MLFVHVDQKTESVGIKEYWKNIHLPGKKMVV